MQTMVSGNFFKGASRLVPILVAILGYAGIALAYSVNYNTANSGNAAPAEGAYPDDYAYAKYDEGARASADYRERITSPADAGTIEAGEDYISNPETAGSLQSEQESVSGAVRIENGLAAMHEYAGLPTASDVQSRNDYSPARQHDKARATGSTLIYEQAFSGTLESEVSRDRTTKHSRSRPGSRAPNPGTNTQGMQW